MFTKLAPTNDFSADFVARVKVNAGGEYEIITFSDDNLKMFINGVKILDKGVVDKWYTTKISIA
jgi:hypothetical protein